MLLAALVCPGYSVEIPEVGLLSRCEDKAIPRHRGTDLRGPPFTHPAYWFCPIEATYVAAPLPLPSSPQLSCGLMAASALVTVVVALALIALGSVQSSEASWVFCVYEP